MSNLSVLEIVILMFTRIYRSFQCDYIETLIWTKLTTFATMFCKKDPQGWFYATEL